jgi:hypothetical protein
MILVLKTMWKKLLRPVWIPDTVGFWETTWLHSVTYQNAIFWMVFCSVKWSRNIIAVRNETYHVFKLNISCTLAYMRLNTVYTLNRGIPCDKYTITLETLATSSTWIGSPASHTLFCLPLCNSRKVHLFVMAESTQHFTTLYMEKIYFAGQLEQWKREMTCCRVWCMFASLLSAY